MTDLTYGPPQKAPTRLTLRLAVLLLAGSGRLPHELAVQLAAEVGGGSKRTPERRVAEAMKPLRADKVADKVGDAWYTTNLADLAAWIADGYAYREEAGYAEDPALPVACV